MNAPPLNRKRPSKRLRRQLECQRQNIAQTIASRYRPWTPTDTEMFYTRISQHGANFPRIALALARWPQEIADKYRTEKDKDPQKLIRALTVRLPVDRNPIPLFPPSIKSKRAKKPGEPVGSMWVTLSSRNVVIGTMVRSITMTPSVPQNELASPDHDFVLPPLSTGTTSTGNMTRQLNFSTLPHGSVQAIDRNPAEAGPSVLRRSDEGVLRDDTPMDENSPEEEERNEDYEDEEADENYEDDGYSSSSEDTEMTDSIDASLAMTSSPTPTPMIF